MRIAPEMTETTLPDLFAAQAARTPEAVAVVSGRAALTYAELDRRSAALAAFLRTLGVGPDVPVGLHVERGADMVVALLGILRAGGAYVPLDPDFPAERLAYMVADAAAPVVISQAVLQDGRPATSARLVLLEEAEVAAAGSAPGAAPHPPMAPGSAAYVMYTSGSTGRPKGVVIEHGNVANFLLSMREEPGLAPADVLVAVTTLSFDISVLELFLPLVVGARVVVADRDTATSGELLAALLAATSATVMQATPATWRLLIEAGWTGGPGFKALCGGEALPADLARELWTRAGGGVWNMYGPTETTVWSTCHRLAARNGPILIGHPIANTQVYVLSRTRQPVPVGVPGEIYIGGLGVARGYLGRDALTAERFLPDPFRPAPGARMYRTGDVGRYLTDGTLEFRSRADNQVKVRGFRIELGEVETALAAHAAVKQAVAAVVEAGPGDARLVAYVLAEDGAEVRAAALREHLGRTLPHYMIPQHFVPVERFPLTPNGKVDRAQLPAPGMAERAMEETYVPPRTAAEQAVAAAWADVMAVPRVSADANFFQLGGHSVLAVRVVSRLRRELGVPLTLRHVFLAPTVAALAREIEALQPSPPEGRPGVPDEEEVVF